MNEISFSVLISGSLPGIENVISFVFLALDFNPPRASQVRSSTSFANWILAQHGHKAAAQTSPNVEPGIPY